MTYRKHINVVNTMYGHLMAIEEISPYIDPSGHSKRRIKCRCVCGKEVIRLLVLLTPTKHKHHCGCKNMKHRVSHTPIHRMWCNMKKRCYKSNANGYSYYGGRGISVCEVWRNDFMVFYQWALMNSYKEGLQIDRINVNGNYEPTNCRFVTRLVNANNKRNIIVVNVDGKDYSLADACRKLNIFDRYGMISQRIRTYKWSIERALIV